jgi:hypothetical protein
MQDLRTELMAILQAVAFPAPGIVALAGRTVPPAAQTREGNPMVGQLQALFYDHCYCRRFGSVPADRPAASSANFDLGPALSAANASRDRWDGGWQVRQALPNGQIVAVKGAMTRMVWPGGFLAHGSPGSPVQSGIPVSLFAPRESLQLQPGFYFAFGETLRDEQEEFGVVRFYWNINADGAPRLIGAITAALNRWMIPFHFKCMRMQALFDRNDSAVLYVARRYTRIVTMLLPELYAAVRNDVKPAVPLFSKQLADGLGFAEDPQTGESFGMNRCRLMAEAVCRAREHGHESAEARLDELAAVFAVAGLSFERPYLNAGSAHSYDFPERLAA